MHPKHLALITALIGNAQPGAVQFLADNATFATSPERWDDSDLHRFVTRRDLTPPKFDIIRHDRERTSAGYFFVAPFPDWQGESTNTRYVSQQVGPMIYDQDGELVWSGAEHFRDMDFRAVTINGSDHVTFIRRKRDNHKTAELGGYYVLDSSYQVAAYLEPALEDAAQDMHEFRYLNDSNTALMTSTRVRQVSSETKPVVECLFHEINVDSREIVFEWASLDHVPVSETTFPGRDPGTLDYFHMNSVEKTVAGDYVVSARHVDCIYLVSGNDGSIIWRFGGRNSSFELAGFHFSRQHDARVLSQNSSMTIISFLDNATNSPYGDPEASADLSSLLVVALHTATTPMRATVLREYPRPDGEYTGARGNVQILPDGNVFGHWGDNGYMTEFTESGDLVFEAIMMSSRFQTYRAYKMNFTGQPADKPVVKASVQASAQGFMNTVIFVSWNGATEVAEWRMYATEEGHNTLVGTALKTGFETAFVATGYHKMVFVEAVDRSGRSLGNSSHESTELPLGWDDGHGETSFAVPAAYLQAVKSDSRATVALSFVAGVLSTWLGSKFARSRRVVLPSDGVALHWAQKYVVD